MKSHTILTQFQYNTISKKEYNYNYNQYCNPLQLRMTNIVTDPAMPGLNVMSEIVQWNFLTVLKKLGASTKHT